MSGAETGEFARMLDEYRGEIRRHCYRMLGSLEDAEDVTQETLLRAWRAWDSFAGRSSFRTWVYRIATNACIDYLRRESRRPTAEPSEFATVPAQVAVPWLQPYPEPSDAASLEPGPDQRAVARETIRLAFPVSIASTYRSTSGLLVGPQGPQTGTCPPGRVLVQDGAHGGAGPLQCAVGGCDARSEGVRALADRQPRQSRSRNAPRWRVGRYWTAATAALTVAGDHVREVATFHADLFEWFGMPGTARDRRHLSGT